MRHYDLNNDGTQKGSYAKPQPRKDLVYLENAPTPEHLWNGEAWVVSLQLYKEMKIEKLDNLFSEWFKFVRTLSPQNIRAAYWQTVDDIRNSATVPEVDIVYNNNEHEMLG